MGPGERECTALVDGHLSYESMLAGCRNHTPLVPSWTNGKTQ